MISSAPFAVDSLGMVTITNQDTTTGAKLKVEKVWKDAQGNILTDTTGKTAVIEVRKDESSYRIMCSSWNNAPDLGTAHAGDTVTVSYNFPTHGVIQIVNADNEIVTGTDGNNCYVAESWSGGAISGSFTFVMPAGDVKVQVYASLTNNNPSASVTPREGPLVHETYATITLPDNGEWHKTITVDPNEEYWLVETSPASGYTIIYEYGSTTETGAMTGKVSGGQVTVSNQDIPGTLQIIKAILSGSSGDGQDFTFNIGLTDSSNAAFNGTVKVTDKTRGAEDVTVTGGALSVTVTGAGTAIITGLPAGTKYTVTEAENTGWISQGEVYSNSSQTIAANATDTVTVTNAQIGSLTVSKAVQDANDQTISTSAAFPITVTVVIDGETYYVQDKNGVLGTSEPDPSLAVTGNESLTINNLPYGAYTVNETAPESVTVTGYTFTITGSVTSGSATVNAATGASVGLSNKYTRDVGGLKITKAVQLNGTNTTDAKANGTYTFAIYESTGATQVTEKADGTEIGTLEITVTEGVASPTEIIVEGLVPDTYVVKETASTNDHITLDSEKRVTVSAGSTIAEEATAAFVNNYETTTITLTKTWDDTADSSHRPTEEEFLGAVELKADGTDVSSTYAGAAYRSVRENNNIWTVTWTNLPKNSDNAGTAIAYTVEENAAMLTYYTAGTVTETSSGEWTVTNTLKPGSLNITKFIETGTEGAETFTFQVVLTPATGVAIDPNNLTVTVGSIGTITPANPAAGESVTLTLTISGATASNPQTATISGIPAGTTYEVTEINLPDGWYQAGEVEYTDADKTVAANETADTVTITNKKALSISVTKVWTIDGQPKTTAQSIEFELHQVLKQNGEVKQDRVYTGVAGNTTGKFTVNYDNSTTPGTWETVTITGLPLKDTATVSDGGEGTTTIDGCDAFYYVVETPASADAGYVLATTYSNEAQAANPSGTASSKAVNTNNSTITIINEETPGVVLPSTGGPGTAAYTVSGLALMLGAIWMLLRRKRQMN